MRDSYQSHLRGGAYHNVRFNERVRASRLCGRRVRNRSADIAQNGHIAAIVKASASKPRAGGLGVGPDP